MSVRNTLASWYVDEPLHDRLKSELQMSQVAGVFAVLVILISCIGLFGLSVFLAGQGLKEIGVRKILGAGVPGLVILLSGSLLRWVLLSCLIAFPVAARQTKRCFAVLAYFVELCQDEKPEPLWRTLWMYCGENS